MEGAGHSGGQSPLLVGATAAVPDLQPGSVGRDDPGGVETATRLWIHQRAVGLWLPLLGAGAVAVVQLRLRAVRRAATGQVHALTQRPKRAVRSDGPALRGRAVAVIELHRGAVGRVRADHVDALAAEPGDRTGATASATRAGDAAPGEGGRG